MVYRLADLALDDARLGGKGRGLRRLLAAGLPVPETLVVPAAVDDRELPRIAAESLAILGTSVLARSSAADEDGRLAGAPGIFLSRPADDRDGLVAAIRAVRRSVDAPIARAYRG